MQMRIGNGFDVHAFAAGRPLVIGGVTIPFDRGLAGHSDADVLLHAIGDAIIGALALGDKALWESFADAWLVLADASGEHEAIEPAEGRRQRAGSPQRGSVHAARAAALRSRPGGGA